MARRDREERLAKQRLYYQEHQDYFREYWQKHREQKRQNTAKSNARVRQRNPNQYKARMRNYQKEYRNKIRQLALDKVSGGDLRCAMCGEARRACLTIDHIHGSGKKHKRTIGAQGDITGFYRWLLRNNTENEFQILCMNCQWIKRDEKDETH